MKKQPTDEVKLAELIAACSDTIGAASEVIRVGFAGKNNYMEEAEVLSMSIGNLAEELIVVIGVLKEQEVKHGREVSTND